MKYIVLVVSLFITTLHAQVVEMGPPKSWSLSYKSSNIPKVTMPGINLKKLAEEDAVNDIKGGTPYRFGYELSVDLGFKDGVWKELKDGSRIWQLTVVSKGAKTLNFVFDQYTVPKGATLHFYNADRSDLLGAYTDLLNRPDAKLGTWLVKGSEVTIEYHEPRNVRGQGKVNLSKVVHGYRSITDLEAKQRPLNDSEDCNLDVECPIGNDFEPQKNNLKRAVGLLLVGGGFCSGTLINNTNEDKAPYFLSANHCYDEQGQPLRDPAIWAFRFNWISPNPSCATTTPSTQGSFNQTTSGATLLANNRESDVVLVRIDTALPDAWNLEWAGWDRTGNVPSYVVGIHHPSGDIMKVCRQNRSPLKGIVNFNGNPETKIWRITDWDLGVTERGSSGSALFDPNGRIIGKLSGGTAACNGTVDNGSPDFYGRFDVSWDFGTTSATRLSDWLDPENKGDMVLDMLFGGVVDPDPGKEDEMEPIIFPNPTRGDITINNATGAMLTYVIYDVYGQLVASGQTNEEEPEELDLSSKQTGVYFLKLTNTVTDKTYVRKILLY